MAQPHPVQTHHEDFIYMQQALVLAAQGLGRVWPNPSVGCLVVKDREIVGQARTADGGRPHAETQALAQAEEKAQGATVYITLEPCGHTGLTPPCVEELIKARVARVVYACPDPGQRENNIQARLESAGIAVSNGVLAEQAKALNEGFFTKLEQARPFVTAKIATTLDGRIATKTGESRWITGKAARQKAHEYRAQNDAVLVGVGTVLADDPALTVRLPDYDGPQPVRIVIDHDLKTPVDSRLLQEGSEVWFLHGGKADTGPLADKGAKLVELDSVERRFEPETLLKFLGREGLTRLFVEGGGHTLGGFMKAGMIDRLLWFRAPKLIGSDGFPAIGPLDIEQMDEVLEFALEERLALGEDLLEIWRLRE